MKFLFIFFTFCFITSTASCQNYKILKLNAASDSCFTLPQEAYREIEIVENTLTDTIGLGYSILAPEKLGTFIYRRAHKGNDGLLYLEMSQSKWPKTPKFCFDEYKKRKAKGYIIIKYRY